MQVLRWFVTFGVIGATILTAGCGSTDTTDITYATPFFWLLERIKNDGFPNAYVYPDTVLAP